MSSNSKVNNYYLFTEFAFHTLRYYQVIPGQGNPQKRRTMFGDYLFKYCCVNPKQAGGGGIRPQAGSSLCCAETVSSRKLKLSDFYYILIGLNSEYKTVPWDIHCCHGNAIVEWCSVKFWLKSVENCIFLLKSFSNLSLGLLFVISISKLPPVPNFKQIGLKAKKLGFSTFFLAERSLKYKMTS